VWSVKSVFSQTLRSLRFPVSRAVRDFSVRFLKWHSFDVSLLMYHDNPKRLRILWIKLGGLWPPDSGGRLRSFHILSELARRHEVTVLTTHQPEDDPDTLAAHLPAGTKVIPVPYVIPKAGSVRFFLLLLRSWFSSLPVDLMKCRIPELSQKARQLIDNHEVDLCVADFLNTMPNLHWHNNTVPVVFFAHNVEHMIWKRLCQVKRGIVRLLLEFEWRKMRRYEIKACARASITLAVSDADRELFATLAPGAALATVPTGVDTVYFTPHSGEESAYQMVFTGSMDWYPNEDAILYFLEHVLPRIRRELPAAVLTVVGRNPSLRLRTRAAEAGVRVTGLVVDVRPYIAEAAIYIVPLRVGGGTRLKIFEALSMGKAVVSTSIGAEGLPVVPGEHIVLADDPDDFARQTINLLRDPVRLHSLGTAGRRLVEERYSWPQVARAFEAHCRDVVLYMDHHSPSATTPPQYATVVTEPILED
jgi:sugar transferase (PEP-CTERM/EpsH1 system associated)